MEILTSFGVDGRMLIAQIINFVILFVAMKFWVYPKIVAMLNERKTRIAESMKQAQDIEDRLAKLESDQAAILKKAQQEADRLIKEAKDNSKLLADQTIAQAKDDAHQLVLKAQAQSKAEFEKMEQALKADIAQIAVTAAQKAVSAMLTSDQKQKLLDKAKQEILS